MLKTFEVNIPKHVLEKFPSWVPEAIDSLSIDKGNLDMEMTCYAMLYMQCANLKASCLENRDRAKKDLEEIRTALYLSERHNLEMAGEKFTESVLNSRVVQRPEYRNAMKILHEKDVLYGYSSMLLDAVRAKGDMLKYLTQLWVGGYFTVQSS